MRKDVFIISCITCLITSAGCDETIPDLCDFSNGQTFNGTKCVCNDPHQKFDSNGVCVCSNPFQEVNASGKCVCSNPFQEVNASGKCVCTNSYQELNDKGECVCTNSNQELNASGQCICTNSYQKLNDKGECVCANSYQKLNDKGECVCANSYQKLNDAGQCVCINDFQKPNETTGVCECIDTKAKLDANGMCSCSNPNMSLNERGECVLDGDNNRNHMFDRYEADTIDLPNNTCRKHSDCASGFCDSFLGYKCSTRCTNHEQCVGDTQKDGFNYVCRSDGRCAPDAFTTVWNIAYNNEQSETIQFIVNCKDKVHVSWGDGQEDDVICGSSPVVHTYYSANSFIVEIKGSFLWTLDFNDKPTGNEKTSLSRFAGIRSFGPAGIGIKSFVDSNNFMISEVDIPDSTLLTSMERTFYRSAFNQDISHWDVSNVTNMSSVFNNASSFNQDIGRWDTSNVTKMNNMFLKATAFDQDLCNWDVSKVTSFEYMFYMATAFRHSISCWANKVKTDGANGYLMLTGSGLDDPASNLCKDTTNLNDTLKIVSGFGNICKKE